MLLQTFVQLNILLFATPALVGWAAVPTGQPLLTHAAASVRPLISEPVEHASLIYTTGILPQIVLSAPASPYPTQPGRQRVPAVIRQNTSVIAVRPYPTATRAP